MSTVSLKLWPRSLGAAMLGLGFLASAASAQYPAQPPNAYPPQQQQSYPTQPQYPAQPQYGAQQPEYSQPGPPPPPMAPPQMDQLVSRIALYPDPLLAQTLTAATFWPDIPAAATWAMQHSYLTGDALGQAVQEDALPWDPSILGLLPFPSVLDMMARDPGWTAALGQQVLANRPAVMDAVQRERAVAYNYGYLRPNPYENVIYAGGYYQIVPVDPAFYYVPVYDPGVVFFPPRRGFAITAAISFGPRVVIGGPFLSFGWWGSPRIDWAGRGIFVGGAAWGRTWGNRTVYAHPYPHPWVRPAAPYVERHQARPESRPEGHERPHSL